MLGKRMYLALEALKLFLHSIPFGSKFNIISYGEDYRFLFPKSMNNTDDVLDIAMYMIADFEADMGGTEIFAPLNEVFRSRTTESCERHIYLLTDGAVNNTAEVVELIRMNKYHTRVHMFGIGEGASSELIKEGAYAGDGHFYFINKEEDLKAKVVEALSS